MVITRIPEGFVRCDELNSVWDIYVSGETYEGYRAAEMRYGFDPATKSDKFVRAYNEYTEQLYPMRHGIVPK